MEREKSGVEEIGVMPALDCLGGRGVAAQGDNGEGIRHGSS